MVSLFKGRAGQRVFGLGALLGVIVWAGSGAVLTARGAEKATAATNTGPGDPIVTLQRRLDGGQAKLRWEPQHGYLRSVLQQLQISTASQMLVFSKTSFQRKRISPLAPRALYFNNQTYIGWVQGGPVVEVASVDPQTGPVFYTLSQEQTARPHFLKQRDECLSCHASALTHNIPGVVMRSVYPGRDGEPIVKAGSFLTTDDSPMKERWGGWYVTGASGNQYHMGNQTSGNADEAASLNLEAGSNVTKLNDRLEIGRYLTPHSDIVALMVMEHQTKVQNLITHLTLETRKAMAEEGTVDRFLDRWRGGLSDEGKARLKRAGEPLVESLLFAHETPLTAPVRGTSGFTAEFAKGGARDPQSRSLRELDLQHRLFRYPCSYMIHSPAFDAMPPLAKAYVYRRLHEVLDGKDTSPIFARLAPADRTAVREILTATKPEFAKTPAS